MAFYKRSTEKKPGRILKSFTSEYNGNCFDLIKRKTNKKVEYVYEDVSISRKIDKKHYKNIVKNSEILYDNKKGKYIRF